MLFSLCACICLNTLPLFCFGFVFGFFPVFQIRVVNAFRMALDARYDGHSLSSNYSSQSLENLRMRYKFPASPRIDASASTNQAVDTSVWACTALFWTMPCIILYGSIQMGTARAAVGNIVWLTYCHKSLFHFVSFAIHLILFWYPYSFRTWVLSLLYIAETVQCRSTFPLTLLIWCQFLLWKLILL